jgi:hypothetical protein
MSDAVEHEQGEPDILCRVVGEEALLLDTRTGDYYSLDPIGTEIWQQLNAGQSVDEIAADVAERWRADADRVRQDIVELMDELRDARLWR